MMWLVVGGPATVVVASFATLALAILNPDPVIDTHVVSHGGAKAADDDDAADLRAHSGDPAAHLPAMVGRNHAATGGPKEVQPQGQR
jgi:hypothetical protein